MRQEVQGGGDNTPFTTITSATGQEKPKLAPVLPANAGDLFFEYTPAATAGGGDGGGGSGGEQGGAEAGKGKGKEQEGKGESNRAPSPGGYTASRTIFIVSCLAFLCGDENFTR